MLRICRKLNIKSTIKYSNNGCTRQAASPQYIAENILNREFTAKAPNEKWLTDVTEFHYYIGMEKHKVYLSAILDLYDRRIVSYVIRDKNNNALVFDTVDNALLRNPGAQPLFHSDRGFQYTNRTLHKNCQQINFCWQEKFIFFSIVYLTGSSSFIRYNSPLIPTVCFVLHSPTILPNYIPTCTKYHFLIFISGFLKLFICLFVFIHIIICLI